MSIIQLSQGVADALLGAREINALRAFLNNPTPTVSYRVGTAMMRVNRNLGLGCIYYSNALRVYTTAKMTSSEDILKGEYKLQHDRSAQYLRAFGVRVRDANLEEIFDKKE